MNAIILPSLLLICGADDAPPAPKLPLGKDTTYVVGPLDKYGYIDYEAALNAEMSKGVTPDKNANALLVRAFGLTTEGEGAVPTAYFTWLDVPIPPKDGDYLLSLNDAPARLGLTQEQAVALFEFQDRAVERPWVPKDCAPLAEWLKVNEKPLALVVEAVKRPAYFSPHVSRRKEGEPGSILGALVPAAEKGRSAGSALACRAMLRLSEKKYAAAWADILACHRLGRHLTYGATIIEVLTGIAVCQIANTATLTYLDRADLTAERALDQLKELRALRPVASLAQTIGLTERMGGLETLQLIRRGDDPNLTAAERKAVDWTPAMQVMNGYYDRVSAAMRLKDRAAREKEFDAIEKDLDAAKKDPGADDLSKLIKDTGAKKGGGKKIGETLIGLLMLAFRKAQQAHDRCTQTERNLHIACALAAYRADAERYPARLADLAPEYLAEVPADLFGGRELVYKPTESGYRLYSVGVNGKDDAGRGQRDDPPGDDLAVRMPLPEPKKK